MPESYAQNKGCFFGGVTSSGCLEESDGKLCSDCGMPLQWLNQFWPSLEEGAGKRRARGIRGASSVA